MVGVGGGGVGWGWWDPRVEGLCVVAAYQAVGVGSYAASLADLSGNGNDAVSGGTGPTWDTVNGWSGFGVSAWVNSGITPATDQSYSMLVRYAGATAGYSVAAGSFYNGATVLGFGCGSGPWNAGWFANGTPQQNNTTPVTAAGVYGVVGDQPYLDGVAVVGPLGGWAGGVTSMIAIGGLWSNGAQVSNAWPGSIQAVAIYECNLSEGAAGAVSAAMAAL